MSIEDTSSTQLGTAAGEDPPAPAEASLGEAAPPPSGAVRRPTETWDGPPGSGSRPALEAESLRDGSQVWLGVESALTVVRELGRGGMGTVYLVHDPRLGREAALKVVRDPTPDRVERFRREAEITARLSHPAIPPVYDAGQTREGLDYLLMRHVSGRSLAERFDRYHERRVRRSRSGRRMPVPRDLLEVLVKISEALAYAHSRGVLHRDLKPQNVLLGPFGETVLLDWGLALDTSSGEEVRSEMVGTVGYMAPEQARREPVDARADVFGLGALLTEALTGRLPAEGETVSEVLEHLRAGAVRRPSELVPDLPPELDAIAARATAGDPAKRYPDAASFGEDLRSYLAGLPVSVYRESPVRRVRRLLAQHPTLVVAIVLGLAGATLIARARAWERAAVIREAQSEVSSLRRRAAQGLGDPLGHAWGLLTAGRRWYALAPDDPDAKRALHVAALRLGDLALESGQWTLARRAYGEAAGLGINDSLIGAKLERVAQHEAAEVEYRRERIELALEVVDTCEEPPRAALDELVFHGATRGGLRQLLRALELAAKDLAWAEVRLLLGQADLAQPKDPGLLQLNEALIELRERAPTEPLLKAHADALAQARARAVERARAQGLQVADYWALLALRQREACVDSLRRGAALIEVLRRLVRLESAQRSVFHYGCFVADRASALAAAEVLVDLGAGRSALGPVEKYGTDSEEARAILARLRERAR
ncbi:MAG: protein kinase [Planctomycetes bacterium]|nr:protein kinase [Planctomycetota bacterium]